MVGNNPLVQFIADNEWQRARDAVQRNSALVKRWSVAQSFTGDLRPTEILPIHQACAKTDVSVHFIEALFFAYPESLLKREHGAWRLPLHIALRAHATDDVILFLLEKCPEAATIQDALGRVPLHYANSNSATSIVMDKLMEICPGSVRAADNMGWTPLHVASSLGHSAEIVRKMITISPEAVMMATTKGSSPITCADRNKYDDRELIISLLLKEEQKFQKMPAFQNMREAEKREKTTSVFEKPSLKCIWGVRKRVRSNSIRRVV